MNDVTFCVFRPLLLLSFLSHVIPQLMGPAPSWHPGGSDSPASLWDKGGEKEGWEGRKEERMNQNTIKMTMWPFWELRGRWLEAMSHRQQRERDAERDEEAKSGWDLLSHDKERSHCSLCWQQNKMPCNLVIEMYILYNPMATKTQQYRVCY